MGRMYSLYKCFSPDIIRMVKSKKVRWLGQVACILEMRSTYRILVMKPGKKGLLGRLKCRLEDYF
jgi:hypothetical protein